MAGVSVFLLAYIGMVYGQSITGQIVGTVVDPSGAAVQGATVQLTNDLTKQTLTFTTASNGSFVFPDLVPGIYSAHMEMAGFKAYDQLGIVVDAQEDVDLRVISLRWARREIVG